MRVINNVDELIRFIIPLFVDEFNIVYNDDEAIFYFLHGGCYELAKVIKNYFPTSEYALSKDFQHIAILYKEKIYDASICIKKEKKKYYNTELSNFNVVTEEDLNKATVSYGRDIYINGKSIDEALIEEINNIESIKVIDNDRNKNKGYH